ncbi:DUF2069 domain-containing protein [Pleionea sp. CnH1-48]|uniref:DUF2069 domain-containing protein n=1 Tax=Pleionea sp. CnH1-48 TaxID=2954494 RepID=UPI0020982E1D|nr:DUF2069 domain-containing protein [Pleionea sp. CnH1-48]MCO7223078.1 DUF2069 domain-containing protein [Pleionea sp. CnH1-48]
MNKQQKINLFHRITQASYFALLALLILWLVFLHPAENINPYFVAAVWIIPLLFPMPGMIQKKLYTYAWAQFLNMIYFSHAIMYMMSEPDEFWLATLELILVMTFFTTSIITIRLEKRS